MSTRYFIGTQGWSYSDWSGPFYPRAVTASGYLAFYASAFTAVEVDSSFYAIPPASHFRGWRDRTPPSFRFALKLPGELTHERRLRGGDEVLTTFCKRAELLDERLGVLLVQLPPDFTPRERAALESFLGRLPGGFRFAVEFRRRGWLEDDTFEALGEAGVGLAVSEGPWIPRRQVMEAAARPTAPFSYIRWLGDRPDISLYTHLQIDRATEIGEWAKLLLDLEGKVEEVYGFFNNHYEGHSPASARRLLEHLGEPVVSPGDLDPQLSLFEREGP